MKKAIISVLGKDRPGIIARTTAYLSKVNVNILDISQTVRDGFFNMMMIVDLADCVKTFDKFHAELVKVGEEIGVDAKCQTSEIFEKMYRL